MTAAAPTPARKLPPEALCRRCDPAQFSFTSTQELEDIPGVFAQERATESIRFGIGMAREGYNLFVMGPEGIGRHTIVRLYLEEQAKKRPVPSDWCYLFNFKLPHKPRALRLPAGTARPFRDNMARLVEDLRAAIPAAFESDEYRAHRQEIDTEFSERQEEAIGKVGRHAESQNIALLRTPSGFGFAPTVDGTVMPPADFAKLPPEEQKRLEAVIGVLQEELAAAIRDFPKWRNEAQRKLRDLNRLVTNAAVTSLIDELKVKHAAITEIPTYLDEVRNDVLDHAEVFQQPREAEARNPLAGMMPDDGETQFRRYQVNLLIDHGDTIGAPIVYEDNPTHDVLVGRTEHVAQMGTLMTDFTLIKAGALHRANGGYLILDAARVLTQPLAWDTLKRALRAREIRTESFGQALSLITTVTIEPEAIPLDVKLVLVGERTLYYLLHEYDPEFSELFKVGADFEDDMHREPGSDALYARMIATLARKEKLLPLAPDAVARVIEHAAREAGDGEKLSLRLRDLSDLLRESDFWARDVQSARDPDRVTAPDVERAIEARAKRAGRIHDRQLEAIVHGTLLIDTVGSRVGQANGLAVMELGGHLFGMPHRITSRVRTGGGRLIDIEREVALGGPLHSKGVLILSGYLSGHYAIKTPLALTASLVFEQSYGGVDGDSASMVELVTLLSAIGDLPLHQGIAMTGSINQQGDMQAIGGVNEKIEGFFRVCKARGLDGSQGVIIPAANERHLMLKAEVVSAVAEGKFSIYTVTTVDEALFILCGLPAGERDALGDFPAGTANHRIEERLIELSLAAHFPVAEPRHRPLPRHPRRVE